jgi:hypothetical protein
VENQTDMPTIFNLSLLSEPVFQRNILGDVLISDSTLKSQLNEK